jgi:outer membrane scaffolding protein for murein synthesis (MipA/OmpV family)
MDRKMANYMWGVSTNAHERMLARKKIVLPAYEISESIINYDGTLVLTYTFGNSWTILSYASSTLISSTIRENPGINKDFDITVGLGLAYNF